MKYCNSVSVDLTGTLGQWVRAEMEVNDSDLMEWAAERELDLTGVNVYTRFLLMRAIVETCLVTDLKARNAISPEQANGKLATTKQWMDETIAKLKAKNAARAAEEAQAVAAFAEKVSGLPSPSADAEKLVSDSASQVKETVDSAP